LDYERGRLQSQLQSITNERDLAKSEVQELQVKYTTLVTQNERLKEQLRLLEQESFEIQARLRRGIEVERENENFARS
jgi:predicted  nucleic acid-binding Zn-ribbon protein